MDTSYFFILPDCWGQKYQYNIEIELVKVSILVLFLIWEGRHLIFYLQYDVHYEFFSSLPTDLNWFN